MPTNIETVSSLKKKLRKMIVDHATAVQNMKLMIATASLLERKQVHGPLKATTVYGLVSSWKKAGKDPSSIAHELNRRGVTQHNGCRWRKESVDLWFKLYGGS